MYWVGHVGAAAIAYAPVGAWLLANESHSVAFAGLLVAVSVSTLPDVDEFLPIPHRGPTHTIWFVGGCSIVVGASAAAVTPAFPHSPLQPSSAATLFAGVTTLSLSSHLIADAVTPMGIRPFEPLSAAEYSLDLVYAKNRLANLGLFVGGVLSLLVAFASVQL